MTTTAPCPRCREPIHPRAVVCKHCGAEFTPGSRNNQSPPRGRSVLGTIVVVAILLSLVMCTCVAVYVYVPGVRTTSPRSYEALMPSYCTVDTAVRKFEPLGFSFSSATPIGKYERVMGRNDRDLTTVELLHTDSRLRKVTVLQFLPNLENGTVAKNLDHLKAGMALVFPVWRESGIWIDQHISDAVQHGKATAMRENIDIGLSANRGSFILILALEQR